MKAVRGPRWWRKILAERLVQDATQRAVAAQREAALADFAAWRQRRKEGTL